jgi:hypothetical protein
VQVLELYAARLQAAQQFGDAGVVRLRVEGIDDLGAIGRQFQLVGVQSRRHRRQRLLQGQRQLLFAELAHQRALVFDQDDLAVVDDADPVGHLLGFLDIVGSQDDGHAPLPQSAHHFPHVAAQLHVHAGSRLVQEQDFGLVRQRLGNQHAPLHAAGQRHHLGVPFVPKRQRTQDVLDVGRIGWQPEQAAAEGDRSPHGFEHVGEQFLRDQADLAPRRAIVAHHVVAGGEHRAFAGRDQPANDADQGRLARAVRPEQGEDLALADVQVDALERLEAAGVGFLEVSY